MKIEMKYKKEIILIIILCYVSLIYQESIYLFKGYKYQQFFKFTNYFLLIVSIFLISIRKKEVKLIIGSIILLICSSISYVDVPKISEVFSILLRSYFIFILLLVKDKKKLYIFFYNILSFLCFCSMIQYLMYNFGFKINLSEIIPDNLGKAKLGIIYLKSHFIVFIFDGYNILKRFQLFFEEPGTLGTLIGMLLVFDEDYRINKFKRIVLIISGILTQSTAFFILYLFKLVKGLFFENSRKMSILILLTLFIGSQSIYFINKNTYEKNYNKVFFVFKKNNREGDQAKLILNNFFKSKKVILGTGNQLYEDYDDLNISSWRLKVYFNGILGSILLFLFILVISRFNNVKKEVKLSILIFFSSFYQRPGIETLANLLILVSGSYYYNFYLIKIENKKLQLTKNEK